MKITAKMTKEQLTKFLGVNAKAVQKADKDLFDRMGYTAKMLKADESKVTKKDLMDLAKEVLALLGAKAKEPVLTPVVENSTKKLSPKKKDETKKAEPKKEEDSSEEENSEESEKKHTKKSAKKTPKKTEEKVELVKGTENTTQFVKSFPKTIDIDGNKYELAEDIKDMNDLYEAYAKDEVLVFAYYWSKRHLRTFPYFEGLFGQPKEFENDLDLATAIHVSDEKKVAYQVSMYTEAFYTILPENLEQIDGVRIASGIEFQIYRAVE